MEKQQEILTQQLESRGISIGYPYLSIAKKYGLPYATVLKMAGVIPSDGIRCTAPDWADLIHDIKLVRDHSKCVRMTGILK